MTTNLWGDLAVGSKGVASLQMVPVMLGTNRVLGVKPMAEEIQPSAATDLVSLQNYGPSGGFVVVFQVAFYGGLILAAPVLFIFLGQMLMPLLRKFPELRKVLGRWMLTAMGLFFAGVLFCYFLLLRVSLYGSVGFAEWMHFRADEWNAQDYVGFVCKFTLAMGLGFELPVVILLLVKVGVLSPRSLARFRPYWVVLNLVVSAFITPDGSPLTMVLMAGPLWVLYEISIWIARSWVRAEKASEAEVAG